MITYSKSNLFDSNAQTLVNTVNCVGVMGKGIAKEFKRRDKEMFDAYKDICSKKQLSPGKLWLWRRRNPWVLNFPTKNHWKGASKIEWIECGLEKFVSTYDEKGITSISFPKLGCGNGGLDWEVVRPLMEHYLGKVDAKVTIHDTEVGVDIPEHFANPNPDFTTPKTFEDFAESIRQLIIQYPEKSRTILDGTPYTATLANETSVSYTVGGKGLIATEDDLRGVWLNLQAGPIAEQEVEWFNAEMQGTLLDTIARLPYTKATPIERNGKHLLQVSLGSGQNKTQDANVQQNFFDDRTR